MQTCAINGKIFVGPSVPKCQHIIAACLHMIWLLTSLQLGYAAVLLLANDHRAAVGRGSSRKVYRCAQQLTWSQCFPFALAAIASGVLTMPRATWVTPTAMPTTGSATTPATPEEYAHNTQLVTAAKHVNCQPAQLHQLLSKLTGVAVPEVC